MVCYFFTHDFFILNFLEQYYGTADTLPESSEYLLEVKQKRKGIKRHRDRRPKAQPEAVPGTLYAPGAIGFVKQEVSSRLNDVADINEIPLPSDEIGNRIFRN